MSREVRRVPADWEHPKDENGDYIPLFDHYCDALAHWLNEKKKWENGEFPVYANEDDRKMSFEEWEGQQPDANDYMPDWPEEKRTHYMMYEVTSEGTPISPVFATPEELARWLTDTGANAFGKMKGSYEGWLRIAKGGYAPAMVFSFKDGFKSGVDGL